MCVPPYLMPICQHSSTAPCLRRYPLSVAVALVTLFQIFLAQKHSAKGNGLWIKQTWFRCLQSHVTLDKVCRIGVWVPAWRDWSKNFCFACLDVEQPLFHCCCFWLPSSTYSYHYLLLHPEHNPYDEVFLFYLFLCNLYFYNYFYPFPKIK